MKRTFTGAASVIPAAGLVELAFTNAGPSPTRSLSGVAVKPGGKGYTATFEVS